MNDDPFDGPPVKVGDDIKVLKMWSTERHVGEIRKVIAVHHSGGGEHTDGLPFDFPLIDDEFGSTHVVAWELVPEWKAGVRPPNDIDEVTDKFFPTEEEKIARYLSDRYGDISNVKQASPNEPPVGYATLGTIENVEKAFDPGVDMLWDQVSIMDVKNQSHYAVFAIQPIEYITRNNMDFLEGNVIKYVSRYKHKNGLEDLLKAKDYLERLIERTETEDEDW